MFYDPITRKWQPYQRVDLTRAAFLQQFAPNAYVETIGERVAVLERRGA